MLALFFVVIYKDNHDDEDDDERYHCQALSLKSPHVGVLPTAAKSTWPSLTMWEEGGEAIGSVMLSYGQGQDLQKREAPSDAGVRCAERLACRLSGHNMWLLQTISGPWPFRRLRN